MNRNRTARCVALLLGLGAAGWGLLLLPVFFWAENPLLPLLFFGPGYVVIAAYVYRVFQQPSLLLRRVIWGYSTLVHGSWLACLVGAYVQAGKSWDQFHEPPVFVGWWLGATALSIVGWSLEAEDIQLER